MLLSPEEAKAAETLGSKSLEILDKAETLPKAQNFVRNVLGAPIEDFVGLLISDPLRYIRTVALAYYQERIRKIHKDRGVTETVPVSPSLAVPLIQAAADETREELQDLWAKLLAAAMDATRADRVRLDFIEAVKKMEPLDALILQKMSENIKPMDAVGVSIFGSMRSRISKELRVHEDSVEVSFGNLMRIGCATGSEADISQIRLIAFGRELMRAVSD